MHTLLELAEQDQGVTADAAALAGSAPSQSSLSRPSAPAANAGPVFTEVPLSQIDPDARLRDATGREIAVGDVLKVFHFIGRRNKRHYMYKQVLGAFQHRRGGHFLKIGHLTLNPQDHYWQWCDGQTLGDYTIVQSVDAAFEDRPRAAIAKAEAA